MNASRGFLKRFDIGFSKVSQTVYKGCSQSDRVTDPDKMNKHAVQLIGNGSRTDFHFYFSTIEA